MYCRSIISQTLILRHYKRMESKMEREGKQLDFTNTNSRLTTDKDLSSFKSLRQNK